MYKYHCLNPISHVGLDRLDENYVKTEDAGEAEPGESAFELKAFALVVRKPAR